MNEPGLGGRVAVVGSINMDLVVQVGRAPDPGETVFGHGLFRAPGGKGANQAVAAARAGARQTVMLGAVGCDDFGDELRGTLAEAGVDTASVLCLPDVPTGTAFIMLEESGENRIVVVPGANGEFELHPGRDVARDLVVCDVVCCSLEVPVAAISTAVTLATAAGKTVVLDPAPAQPLSRQLLRQVSVLTPNLGEARALVRLVTGKDPGATASPETLATALLQLGVAHVLVTLGADGVLYAGPEGREHLPAWPLEVVDTTAAGDALAGALAARLAAGSTVREAAVFANAAGALAVTRRGAQPSMPLRADIEQLIHSATMRDGNTELE